MGVAACRGRRLGAPPTTPIVTRFCRLPDPVTSPVHDPPPVTHQTSLARSARSSRPAPPRCTGWPEVKADPSERPLRAAGPASSVVKLGAQAELTPPGALHDGRSLVSTVDYRDAGEGSC
ncbi:hypothetical protein HBB16_05360 [Pseudonocardia sp. MCCB 268]|nr:hypothetical protein [Pseudonocardia cytotoxica]